MRCRVLQILPINGESNIIFIFSIRIGFPSHDLLGSLDKEKKKDRNVWVTDSPEILLTSSCLVGHNEISLPYVEFDSKEENSGRVYCWIMFKTAMSFLIPSSIIIFTLQSISYNNSGQNTLSVWLSEFLSSFGP